MTTFGFLLRFSRIPGRDLSVIRSPRYAVWGSKNAMNSRLIKLGRSVILYTVENPNPNRPSLSSFPTLVAPASLLIFSKSLSLKQASLYTHNAGPWASAKPGHKSFSALFFLQSRRNFTSFAPASSAFWISSLKIARSSLWSISILFRRVVTGSCGPLCWKPRVSVTARCLLKGGIPNSCAVSVEMHLCTISPTSVMSLSELPSLNHSASQKLTSQHGWRMSTSSSVWIGVKTFLRISGGRGVPSLVR